MKEEILYPIGGKSNYVPTTHGPLSSSFFLGGGLPYRILHRSHKKELLGGLWVHPSPKVEGAGFIENDDLSRDVVS